MSGSWASSRTTGSVVEPFFLRFGLSAEAAEVVHAALRKAGHLAAYAVFAMLALRSVRGTGRTTTLAAGLAFAAAAGLAAADEVLQSLAHGRGGHGSDVLVDALGALIGLCVAVPFAHRREAAAADPLARVPREAGWCPSLKP